MSDEKRAGYKRPQVQVVSDLRNEVATLKANIKKRGETMRFEAACAAMAGILANPTVEWKKNPIEKIAEQCVTHADSLLATLAKEPHD